jgi:hypothetical protein
VLKYIERIANEVEKRVNKVKESRKVGESVNKK